MESINRSRNTKHCQYNEVGELASDGQPIIDEGLIRFNSGIVSSDNHSNADAGFDWPEATLRNDRLSAQGPQSDGRSDTTEFGAGRGERGDPKTLEHQAHANECVAFFKLAAGSDVAPVASSTSAPQKPAAVALPPTRGPAAPKRAAAAGGSGGPVGLMQAALAGAVNKDSDWKEF